MTAAQSFRRTIKYDVFNWTFCMSSAGVVSYLGNYHGVQCRLTIVTGKKTQTIGFERRCRHKWQRFDTADDLLKSFPRLAEDGR